MQYTDIKQLAESDGISFTAQFDPIGFPLPSGAHEICVDFPDGTTFEFCGRFGKPEAIQVPATKWQSFKSRWFPKFLLRMFPVKTVEEISIPLHVEKPDANAT